VVVGYTVVESCRSLNRLNFGVSLLIFFKEPPPLSLIPVVYEGHDQK